MNNLTQNNHAEDKSLKDRQERDAIQYVQNLKGFHMHWISFVVIMPCLYVMNMMLSPEDLWVTTVALGWGSGLLLHGLTLFGIFGVLGGNWEQRQFQKRMDRLNQR